MRVLKFGGTSVAHAENIDRVTSIVEQASRRRRVVVVVSALAGVTNALQAAIEQAVGGTPPTLHVELAARHLACAAATSPSGVRGYRRRLGRTLAALRRLLEGVALLGECPPATRDRILATGERLSAPLLTLALRERGMPARCHDGSSLIVTGPPGHVGVDFAATRRRARKILGARPQDEIAVVTGFVAGDAEGRTTTLGRGASDFSATILGAAAGAERVEIWTDVDGVLSAEPRLVSEAFVLPHLTYGEAADLACLGARVLHPECLQPLVARGIPLFIRNTLRPERAGTRVDGVSGSSSRVRAVTALPVVRFLCRRDGGRRAALPDLDRLEQPPLLTVWEAPGRALSVVVPEAAESQAAEALARSAGSPVERVELALVAVVDGSGDLLSATAPAVLAALAADDIGVKGLFQPAAAPRTLAVLIDRQALPSAVRLLHRELVAATLRHSGGAGRAPAGQLWAPPHGSPLPRGPVRAVAGS